MPLTSEMTSHFEAIGSSGVKREIAEGKHGRAPDSALWREAELWIESDLIRSRAEADAKRDAREERTLAIVESALETTKASASSAQRSAAAAESQAIAAKLQVTWARWAAIIAVVASIVAASGLINP